MFDHAWADAWHRAGGSYYPKLQIAVPFTPVPGSRLLARDNDARQRLLQAGLPAEAIDGEELCTVANPRDFFSYRRDGARSGRLAAVILRK